MTSERYAAFLEELGRTAREKAVAEEAFRKEVARRAEELKTERVFAYRRLNLVRALGAGVAEAKDEEEAIASGRRVLLREAAWTGEITPARAEAAERFEPVIMAVWHATRPSRDEPPDEEHGAGPDVGSALDAFESWYAGARNTSFLHLMEREIVELPLVEV